MARVLRFLPMLLILALPLAATQLPPVRAGLFALIDHMREGTAAGAAMYVATYAVGAVFTAPIALFSGLAGYVYGPLKGFALAWPSVTLAGTVAFLVGRFVLHDPVARWTAKSERFTAILRAVGSEPFKIAVLLRLTPIVPQNFLSYGLSLTRMPVRTFAAATGLGLLPVTAFQAYVGSLVHDAADLIDGKRPPLGVMGWVATVLGLALSLGGMLLMASFARKTLAKSGV
ncbi:DedA family protein, putative [Minicystis rosea]|nr:DedA family protein, putative [Minicystis rosea]